MSASSDIPQPIPSDTSSEAPGVSSPSDDPLAGAQAVVDKWEAFLADQQEKRKAASAVVQDVVNAAGFTARGINPLDPAFAEVALDLEFQRQVSLHYGLKLDQAEPVDTSKPDVSRWRQRTNALKV